MKVPVLDFVRPDDSRLEFELIKVSNTTMPNIIVQHHRHIFFEIIIVEKNSTTQIVDFKTYTVSENEILIIPKNSIHHSASNEQYEGKLMLFTDTFFNQEQNTFLNQLSIFNPITDNKLLRISSNEEVSKYIELLDIEYSKADINFLVLQNLFFTFLLKLEYLSREQYQTTLILKNQNVYLSFILLLETHFKKEHQITFYTETLNITPKKANQIMMAFTGKTLSQLIGERIIIEAKRLLLYSHLSVKEIAYALGFEDHHYFSRNFKKHTQSSPELFRKTFSRKVH